MTAYYNEVDPFAVEWLKNLIRKGLIAGGEVDDRDIRDVRPDDLRGFTQCHFFAGIGVWSYALRQAGWSDDRPVWTGSCPCQPFSTAGRGAGFADERHLWPHWFYLIGECEPPVIFGEQVASKDGLGWLDIVQADLEGAGYSTGAADLCAAGVGAPHIRQRIWVIAERLANTARARSPRRRGRATLSESPQISENCSSGLAHSGSEGPQEQYGRRDQPERSAASDGTPNRLANPALRRQPEGVRECGQSTSEPDRGHGANSGMAYAVGPERWSQDYGKTASGGKERERDQSANRFGECGVASDRSGPTNGFWRDADWLHCRDEKWRPVEPGTFPLAHGATNRVGRLRGYGNAINAKAAQTFIESYLEVGQHFRLISPVEVDIFS